MPLYDAENRLTSDSCALGTRLQANHEQFDYNLLNLRPDGGVCCAQTPRDPLLTSAVQHRNLVPWSGYGWNTCSVDDDSRLRVDALVTNNRGRQQLAKRVFEAAPDMSHGVPKVEVESGLRNGLDTSPLNDCSRVTEKDFRRFIPGVCDVPVESIVPTFWVNGGASSRDIARSDVFLTTMGFHKDGVRGVWSR
jgi:hypothetical protein